MSRRMSVSMTLDAVRARTKTVTRRHVDSWVTLTAGDRLTLIEKGMGLPKGAKQVVVCEVEIVDVRVERLGLVNASEVRREGLILAALDATRGQAKTDVRRWFMSMWAQSHGYPIAMHPHMLEDIPVRRIEWRYLDEDPAPASDRSST